LKREEGSLRELYVPAKGASTQHNHTGRTCASVGPPVVVQCSPTHR
jgi:hypothetical protein